jgi:hypothetical protein
MDIMVGFSFATHLMGSSHISFSCVFRECPLSVTSIQGLLSLGIKWQEVEQLILSAIPASSGIEWWVSYAA